MQTVTIPGTDCVVSRLIFGTASLLKAGGRAKRIAILEHALDRGFTHFDTAPLYGFGAAERDLAPVLAAHPHVGFTTKVGLYAPGGENQPEAAVYARKALGKLLKAASKAQVDFAVARARRSLEASLRRTGRDTVDLYLLHEPEAHLLRFEEWRGWLEERRAAGAIRHWGLAVTPAQLRGFVAAGIELPEVLQVADSAEEREADLLEKIGRPMQITYGYLSAGLRRPDPLPVARILAQALARNASGAIIVSSSKPHRIDELAAVAAADTPDAA